MPAGRGGRRLSSGIERGPSSRASVLDGESLMTGLDRLRPTTGKYHKTDCSADLLNPASARLGILLEPPLNVISNMLLFLARQLKGFCGFFGSR